MAQLVSCSTCSFLGRETKHECLHSSLRLVGRLLGIIGDLLDRLPGKDGPPGSAGCTETEEDVEKDEKNVVEKERRIL